ncbi:MAG TPA: 3-hydroxyacyl-ACP dehydratase FabZ [Thermoanaerobaculia bacterium]|nr:3-hydroxyacyl-ACP dehydratase FabZ [Thermoanaerobaculia bacterium]
MELSIHEILRIIPHRYPFILVDRILEMEPGKRAVGLKNVSINEEFFQGHFPGNPVMPGVLVVEAMAQTAAVCLLGSVPDRGNKIPYFTGIDACKFRRPVIPGDQLRLELEIVSAKLRLCKARGRALVDGKLCAEAVILSSIVEAPGA